MAILSQASLRILRPPSAAGAAARQTRGWLLRKTLLFKGEVVGKTARGRKTAAPPRKNRNRNHWRRHGSAFFPAIRPETRRRPTTRPLPFADPGKLGPVSDAVAADGRCLQREIDKGTTRGSSP